MNKENNSFHVTNFLQDMGGFFTTISDKIWAKPELHFKEKYAVSVMEEALLRSIHY